MAGYTYYILILILHTTTTTTAILILHTDDILYNYSATYSD